MTDGTGDIHGRIERERKDAAPEGAPWTGVRKFRRYARGRNESVINPDQLMLLRQVLKNPSSDNILRKILGEHTNRLRIARFEVANPAVQDFLLALWTLNQLPDLFGKVVYAMLRDGNAAVGLAWKPSDDPADPYGGRVILSRERWWDGTDGVFIAYTDEGSVDYAVKEWRAPLGLRRTVYYDSVIMRFIQSGGGWVPYSIPSDDGLQAVSDITGEASTGILPWTKRDGSGLGVPFVHFANGNDDDTFYGASLLDGGALSFQDQINAIQNDVTAASLYNGSPQTTSKGFSLPKDPTDLTGKRVKMPITGPGSHHHNDEVTAEWGTIPPGSLAELKNAYDLKREAVCLNTDTPLHTITGQWPSGEALFRAEMSTVQAARTRAASVGPSGSTLAHRATEIANAFGIATLDESAPIRTIFEAPEQRDELSRWLIVEKAGENVSKRERLRLAGYPPDRIDEILDELETESEAAAERAQAMFNRGPGLLPPMGGDPNLANDESEEE